MTDKDQATTEQTGCKVCLRFFDGSNPGKPIYLEKASIEVRVGEQKRRVAVQGGEKKSTTGGQAGKQKSTTNVQGKGNVAQDDREPQYIDLSKDLQGLLGGKHEVNAELSLTAQQEVGCTRYVGSSVSFLLKNSDPCCCIPMPLHQVQEACRIKLRAHDSSFADYIENAKSFLNGVEWTVTAVQAPVTAHGSTRQFQPFTAVATSVEGNAEIAEVPHHQLYCIETRGPEGYISEGSSVEYVFVCCETFLGKRSVFCPCGSKPKRSVVFVQQKCQGIRWQGRKVSVGGTELTIDENGIMNVPEDLDGVFPVSWPGKTFSPSSLDLRKGVSPVSTIGVADQTTAETGLSVRGQFVDHANTPFAGRRVSVLLPNGDEIQVVTDEEGFFEAPRGSRVYAREDDFGSATEPVYLTEEI